MGLRVAGGSRIGSMEALAGSVLGLPTRTGRTGVPKAGDDEGTESETAASFSSAAGAIGAPAGVRVSFISDRPGRIRIQFRQACTGLAIG